MRVTSQTALLHSRVAQRQRVSNANRGRAVTINHTTLVKNVDSRVNIRLGAWIEAANLICQRSIHATRVNFRFPFILRLFIRSKSFSEMN